MLELKFFAQAKISFLVNTVKVMARPIQRSTGNRKQMKRERRLIAECEEKGYIAASVWKVRKTWQGRAKYRIAFIKRCGFNTTNMAKLGIAPNYRYADVTGKTKKEVEDKLEDKLVKMMEHVVHMLKAVEDENRTHYYNWKKGWHQDDLYSDWSEEEDEQNEEEEKYEEDEQYGSYQEEVKRRSRRIQQNELAKESAKKQKKEEDAKKWDEELMREWNDKLVID